MRRRIGPPSAICLALLVASSLFAQPNRRTDAFGDPLPKGVRARLGTTRLYHGRMVISVAFSPDGKTLASGGWDNVIHLWEVSSGKELKRLVGHESAVWPVAFSPDGKTIVSGGEDGQVILWDARTGKKLREFVGHTRGVYKLCWADKGKRLITGGFDDTIRFWDVASGEERQLIRQPEQIHGLSLSPDGKVLASADTVGIVRFWDPTSGAELKKVDAHDRGIDHLEYSPDGKMIATSCWDSTAALWDAKTFEKLHTLEGHTENVWPIRFSPDGKLVATASRDSSIRLWSTSTGKQAQLLEGHTRGIPMIAFSPNGKLLASASWDGRVLLWDLATGKTINPPGHRGDVLAVHLSEIGKDAYTIGEDRTLRKWNGWTGKQEWSRVIAKEDIDEALFSGDGRRALIVTDGDVEARWIDVASGLQLAEIRDTIPGRAPVALSHDGSFFVWGGRTRGIVVWDLAQGKPIRQILGEIRRPSSVALSPTNRFVAVGDRGGEVRVWRIRNGKEEFGFEEEDTVSTIAFSPDERTLLTVRSGSLEVVLRELLTGKVRTTLRLAIPETEERRNRRSIEDITWSRSGRFLGIELSDRSMVLWDTFADKQIVRRERDQGELRGLAFSGNERTFATAGEDATALLWDLPRCGLQLRLPNATRSPAELELLWLELAKADPSKAYQAMTRMIVSKRSTVEFLGDRLKPDKKGLDPKTIAKLLMDLDDDDFARREKASESLTAYGKPILPYLRKELRKTMDAEVRQRLREIIRGLADWTMPLETIRELRALEILERVGTPAAHRTIRNLARGAPGSHLTIHARQAVERMGR